MMVIRKYFKLMQYANLYNPHQLFSLSTCRQLHVAVIHGITKAIGPLIKLAPHPCLLDIQNDLSQSALHLAVLTSQPSIVSKLVLAGATVNI